MVFQTPVPHPLGSGRAARRRSRSSGRGGSAVKGERLQRAALSNFPGTRARGELPGERRQRESPATDGGHGGREERAGAKDGNPGMNPPLPRTAVRPGTPPSAAVLPFPSPPRLPPPPARPGPARRDSPLRGPRRTRGWRRGRRAQRPRLREAPSPRRAGRQRGEGWMEGGKEGQSRRPARPPRPGPPQPSPPRAAPRAAALRERGVCSAKLNGALLPSLSLSPQLSTIHGSAEMNGINLLTTRKSAGGKTGLSSTERDTTKPFQNLLFLPAPGHAPKGLVFSVLFKRL